MALHRVRLVAGREVELGGGHAARAEHPFVEELGVGLAARLGQRRAEHVVAPVRVERPGARREEVGVALFSSSICSAASCCRRRDRPALRRLVRAPRGAGPEAWVTRSRSRSDVPVLLRHGVVRRQVRLHRVGQRELALDGKAAEHVAAEHLGDRGDAHQRVGLRLLAGPFAISPKPAKASRRRAPPRPAARRAGAEERDGAGEVHRFLQQPSSAAAGGAARAAPPIAAVSRRRRRRGAGEAVMSIVPGRLPRGTVRGAIDSGKTVGGRAGRRESFVNDPLWPECCQPQNMASLNDIRVDRRRGLSFSGGPPNGAQHLVGAPEQGAGRQEPGIET